MTERIVSSNESGIKLVAFLSAHYAGKYSARQLKQAIEQNRCRINGRTERFASFILGAGDRVSLDLSGFTKKGIAGWTLESGRILFEDQDLIVYNKPAGLNCDAVEVKKSTGYELLHRLDRETTGVLLLAKTREAAKALLLQFKEHEIEKCYAAIVDGVFVEKSGVVENALGKKNEYEGQAIWGEVDKAKGLYSFTKWRCMQTGERASLVYCFPKTGRTHQLRVHMAGLGHPILGDFQYGKRFKCLYHPIRYLLHALEIGFRHPTTNQMMHVRAGLPEDFILAMKHLFV